MYVSVNGCRFVLLLLLLLIVENDVDDDEGDDAGVRIGLGCLIG